MASSTSVPDTRATVLVLDALRPVREALQRVFDDLPPERVAELERQVRWCGSAPVFAGAPQEARAQAARLEALGLTTSVNLRVPAAAGLADQRSTPD